MSDIYQLRLRYLPVAFQISVNSVLDICQLRFRYLSVFSQLSLDTS